MKLILAIATVLASSSVAMAEDCVMISDGAGNEICIDRGEILGRPTQEEMDGSGDERLDHAHAICVYHREQSLVQTEPPTVEYSGPWKPCVKVDEKWARSAAGVAERKRQEQEKRDLDLVNSVAGEK